jgi:hypothetical protein
MSAWVGRQTRPRLALEVGFRGLAVGEQQCEYQSPIPVTACDLLIVICDSVHVKGLPVFSWALHTERRSQLEYAAPINSDIGQ